MYDRGSERLSSGCRSLRHLSAIAPCLARTASACRPTKRQQAGQWCAHSIARSYARQRGGLPPERCPPTKGHGMLYGAAEKMPDTELGRPRPLSCYSWQTIVRSLWWDSALGPAADQRNMPAVLCFMLAEVVNNPLGRNVVRHDVARPTVLFERHPPYRFLQLPPPHL